VSLGRLLAIGRKEFLHVLRDPRSLALAVAMPAMLLLLFGYALKLDVDDVPLAVWDRSRTGESRELVSRFSASRYFKIRRRAKSYGELERAVDESEALIALVIPADFAGRVGSGRPVAVQAIVDGSDPNTATIALGYATVIAATYSVDVTASRLARTGVKLPAAPIDLRYRVWFNSELESRNFIVPGLIAVVMMVIAALLTSLSVSREWERGTMEQLISTPIRGNELILGKLAPYFVIGMVDVLVAVAMGQFLFGVPLRGNAALVIVSSAVFLTGGLAMGMTISVATRNQLVSNQLAMLLTYLPAFLLSGFMFPVANMPLVIRAVSRVVPARYFIAMLRGIYLKGLGLGTLGLELLLLAAFGTVMTTLAVARFTKRLE